SHLQFPFRPSRLTADADLNVSAHADNGLIRYRGWIISASNEMKSCAVAFRNTPQDIVDHVAATFRALGVGPLGCGPDPERFYALLDGTEGCSFCGRALRDEVSKLVGVGPDCARQYGVPHSTAAASRRLELRRSLLGEMA